jgi:predicted nucleic acid-binding protein
MDILIDTNILIMIEHDRGMQKQLQKVIRLFNDLNYRLVIHPSSIEEFKKDENYTNKTVLLSKIEKYTVIAAPEDPADDDTFMDLIGKPGSWRDKYDNHLLYSLYKKKVSYFLTEDPDLHDKAEKLDISGKIMDIKTALTFFKDVTNQKKVMESGASVYCFYKEGEMWRIGEKGKQGFFKNMVGYRFIHLLLSHENQLIGVLDMYSSEMDLAAKYEKANFFQEDTRQDQNSELSADQKIQFDRQSKEKLRMGLALLRKQLAIPGILATEEGIKKEADAKALEAYLRERPLKDIDPNLKKAQSGVKKRLDKALSVIHKDCSSLFSKHLKDSIKTGYKCRYAPPEDGKPFWILGTEQLNR